MRYLLILLCAVFGLQQARAVDFDDLFSGRFSQRSIRGVRPMADGEHYTVNDGGRRIIKYSYTTGAPTDTLYNAAQPFNDYEFSADESKILLTSNVRPIYRHSFTAQYSIYDTESKTLSPASPHAQAMTLSPDGEALANVYENDLYYIGLGTSKMTRITTDGAAGKIINGHTDWVYEEEFGFTRAFEFSPDGQQIAYLRFDETEVPEATILHFGEGLYPTLNSFKYPKAGEPNSRVSLYIYSLKTGKRVQVDTDTEYISRLGWTPDGCLFFYRTNRLQNHFELCIAYADGTVKVLYSEKDARYVERPTDKLTVKFLPDGRFIVRSEKDGYFHLYLNGTKPLTSGTWEVTDLLDVVGDRVYFMSNEGSPLRNNLWSVGLNGRGKRRLTAEEGTYSIAPSAGFKYFISYFSNTSTPLLVRLHDSTGKVLRVLEDNAVVKSRAAELPVKKFFTCPAADGTPLNGWVMMPAGEGRHPVLMHQYSGPGSQQVVDQWGLDWYHALVEHGYAVVCVDGRGTGGRGADFKKCTYSCLGALETEDQIAAARWVSTQSWADPARIGIYGWSFGGFMALNCMLKGADVFKMGIAVAPVTSWRFYDSIYTEIYNGLPASNAAGYDDNSPLNFAPLLKGKLLICHGTADDNVHVQNTMRMAAALTAAGRDFDMRIFPDDNHNMAPHGGLAVRKKMVEYTLENL